MNDTKPREFWIVKWMLTNIYDLRKTKPSWDELQAGDERIHVIEYWAVESLKRELEAVKAERDELKELVRAVIEFMGLEHFAKPVQQSWLDRARKALGES